MKNLITGSGNKMKSMALEYTNKKGALVMKDNLFLTRCKAMAFTHLEMEVNTWAGG